MQLGAAADLGMKWKGERWRALGTDTNTKESMVSIDRWTRFVNSA